MAIALVTESTLLAPRIVVANATTTLERSQTKFSEDGRNLTQVVRLFKPERVWTETAEMVYLVAIVLLGVTLNMHALLRLLQQSSRNPSALTSFMPGPYYISSFSLFKIHLSLTDFAILLIHATGKILWLLTFEWKFGLVSCRLYQFLSAFSYYANSNVVVAIAIDRLKVVYTSRIQGAASLQRVRLLLVLSWLLAMLCALPQLAVWTTIDMGGWMQCTTIWHVAVYFTGKAGYDSIAGQLLYETVHQLTVFWLPFLTLLVSYMLIVMKVLQYTLKIPVHQRKARPTQSRRRRSLVKIKKNGEFGTSRPHGSNSHSALEPSLVVYDSPTNDTCPIQRRACERPFQHSLSLDSHVTGKLSPAANPTKNRLARRRGGVAKDSVTAQLWKSQLRSKVFITSLLIVLAHVAFWLPYNLLNTVRFFDAELYDSIATDAWAVFLEDLIILNSLVNPILYGYQISK